MFIISFIFTAFLAFCGNTVAFEKLKPLLCTDGISGTKGQASATSEVSIYQDINVVRKHVKNYLNFGVFEREIAMLGKLRDFDHVPKILAVDFENNDIYMEYAGEPINANNVPSNWETQAKEIINGLNKRGIQHNDIKPTEILVKNGKIMVIDYGWASAYGQPLDASWPKGIGAPYKPLNGYDDRHSIVKVILQTQKFGIAPSTQEIEDKIKNIWP